MQPRLKQYDWFTLQSVSQLCRVRTLTQLLLTAHRSKRCVEHIYIYIIIMKTRQEQQAVNASEEDESCLTEAHTFKRLLFVSHAHCEHLTPPVPSLSHLTLQLPAVDPSSTGQKPVSHSNQTG